MRFERVALLWLHLATLLAASSPQYHTLPPLKEQASIVDGWRTERLANIPNILRKHGVDAWLMSQREYAEDTAFWSIKRATQFSARRRTVHLFFADAPPGGKLAYQFIDNTPTVFDSLRGIFEMHQPRSIVLNVDSDIAFAGGLHVGMYDELVAQLGPQWSEKFVAAPMVAVEYIATMPSEQLAWYKRLQETAWAMISDAFSALVITPGTTTTEDVEWWLREKIQAMNYSTWFHPSVNIVRVGDVLLSEAEASSLDASPHLARETISYHDMLHVDFGVTALGLNTDTQHLAYVLRPNETEDDIPSGLIDGLRKVNRLQDIVREEMTVGRTGNQILKSSLVKMRAEDIEGKIYCHPIGDWGHAAGTLIGMTNLQDGVPVLGDLPLLNRTYYSVELYAEHYVPERNGTLNFYQEEDVYWVEGDRWGWVYGRQENFHVVRPKEESLGEGGLVVQA